MTSADTTDALPRLAARPEIAAAVDRAREACTRLRWHPALRRLGEPARAEAMVRAAHASATLAGAPWPLARVREAVAGRRDYPADAAGATVRGAVRALAQLDRLRNSYATTVSQTLAALHLAAATGLLPEDQLGRPRPGDEVTARLRQLGALLTAPAEVPALVVAGLGYAELLALQPFPAANDVVARALARLVVVARGLDPTGIVVWEAAQLEAGAAPTAALVGYAGGDPDGVVAWLELFAELIVAGAEHGTRVADAVLAG